MSDHYQKLLEYVYEIHDIQKASAVLGWDRQVAMPRTGHTARTQQQSTLNRLAHNRLSDLQMGDLIQAAAEELNGEPFESDRASLIRLLRYQHENARRLPAEFVTRRTEISAQAEEVWKEARANDDFPSFAPWLQKIIGLAQELAELYGYEDEKYDALLDKYERGAKTAQVRAIFKNVRLALVPLRQAISEKGRAIDDSFLHGPYDVARQKEFAHYIARSVGYDFDRGHLATAVHPFATSFSRDDARITTRWYPDFIKPSLFGTLHESGHAMYEQGTHPDLARTPLARGTSSGIHESQSRLVENFVGRSLGFWQNHYPKLQSLFPERLGGVSAEQFYRAINKVQPSLIRVEADELTYNLHIILRFELEQAMLNGDLQAADLPGAWNEEMEALLGISPPNDREGCLQDTHWSSPSFGYFPTYALGNLYAAQFFAAARRQNSAIDEELAAGQTTSLMAWLGENVYRHGRKFTPAELSQRATGSPLDPQYFIDYAGEKFGRIYQL